MVFDFYKLQCLADMTPMTSAIAYWKEYWFIFCFCLCECLFSPMDSNLLGSMHIVTGIGSFH